MERRIVPSFNPTVFTQYPRGQNVRPNSMPCFLNNSRLIRITLLHLRHPIVLFITVPPPCETFLGDPSTQFTSGTAEPCQFVTLYRDPVKKD